MFTKKNVITQFVVIAREVHCNNKSSTNCDCLLSMRCCNCSVKLASTLRWFFARHSHFIYNNWAAKQLIPCFLFMKLLTSFVGMWMSQAALASLFISSVHKSLEVGIKRGLCLWWWQCLIGGMLDDFCVWRHQHSLLWQKNVIQKLHLSLSFNGASIWVRWLGGLGCFFLLCLIICFLVPDWDDFSVSNSSLLAWESLEWWQQSFTEHSQFWGKSFLFVIALSMLRWKQDLKWHSLFNLTTSAFCASTPLHLFGSKRHLVVLGWCSCFTKNVSWSL